MIENQYHPEDFKNGQEYFFMLLENLEENDTSIRVGSLLELYRLLIEQRIESVGHLLVSMIALIEKSRYQTCEYTVFVTLEILHYIGYNDTTVDKIHLFS